MSDDPMAQLLKVQDLDTKLAQLEHRRRTLAERTELEAAEAGLARLAARAADVAARRQVLLDRQAEMDAQVAALSQRRQAIEDRMYASRGSAARDLQAMDDEIHQLAQRRADIEEAELAVMEEQEPLDAELAQVADERAQLETAAEALRTALNAAEVVVMAEMATVEHERGRGGAGAHRPGRPLRDPAGPPAGVAVARLVGNRCDGCHLELPSAEVDRIRHETARDRGDLRPVRADPGPLMLVLVRHGQATANAAGLLLGRTDVPLTDTGVAQVARWPPPRPGRPGDLEPLAAGPGHRGGHRGPGRGGPALDRGRLRRARGAGHRRRPRRRLAAVAARPRLPPRGRGVAGGGRRAGAPGLRGACRRGARRAPWWW